MPHWSKRWDTNKINRRKFLGLLFPLILIATKITHFPFFHRKRKTIRIKEGKNLAG